MVRLLLEQEFVPLYDADIIAEYEDVLHRAKFPILKETADALISFIIENGIESSRVILQSRCQTRMIACFMKSR